MQNECKEELADMNAKRKQAQDEIDTETATIDNAMKIRQENTDVNTHHSQCAALCLTETSYSIRFAPLSALVRSELLLVPSVSPNRSGLSRSCSASCF